MKARSLLTLMLLCVAFAANSATKTDSKRSAATDDRSTVRTTLPACRRIVPDEQPITNALASQRLAEGISLFEQGRLVPAFHDLSVAMDGGLTDPIEVAMAHKYLAFYYCMTKARTSCEKHMQAALLASPGFDLTPAEKQQKPWVDAYSAVRRRLTRDCAPTEAGMNDGSGIFDDRPPSGIRQTSSLVNAEAPAPSLLRFAIRPWGDVYLNGKRWVTSPPVKEVQLAAGRHRIEVRNGQLAPFAIEFTFTPGGQFLLRHDF